LLERLFKGVETTGPSNGKVFVKLGVSPLSFFSHNLEPENFGCQKTSQMFPTVAIAKYIFLLTAGSWERAVGCKEDAPPVLYKQIF
jgi:hypothetical protein